MTEKKNIYEKHIHSFLAFYDDVAWPKNVSIFYKWQLGAQLHFSPEPNNN